VSAGVQLIWTPVFDDHLVAGSECEIIIPS
jgi:hypothetical protein